MLPAGDLAATRLGQAVGVLPIGRRGCNNTGCKAPARSPCTSVGSSVLGLRPTRRPGGRPVAPRVATTEVSQAWDGLKTSADGALDGARKLLPEAEAAEREARKLRIKADVAERMAKELEEKAAKLFPQAETAVREVRLAAAAVSGKAEEINAADLHSLASQRLQFWRQEHPDVEEFMEVSAWDVGVNNVGSKALLVGHVAAALLKGKRVAVVAIAAAEAFPDARLDGLTLHWGTAGREGWRWEPPPPGWHTWPNISKDAGKAWQTPFESFVPEVGGEQLPSAVAHAVMLQFNMEKALHEGGGLPFVLTRTAPGQKQQWFQNAWNRDFFLSCRPAWDYFLEKERVEKEQAQKVEEHIKNAKEALLAAKAPSKPEAEGEAAETPAAAAEITEEELAKIKAGLPKELLEPVVVPAPNLPKWETVAENWTALDKVTEGGSTGARMLEGFNSAVHMMHTIMHAGTGKDAAALEAAEQAYSRATSVVVEAEEAEHEAGIARGEADAAARQAAEAEERARKLRSEAEVAVLQARKAATQLKGKEEEVSLADLHEVAEERLERWLEWVASRTSMEEPEEGDEEASEEEMAAEEELMQPITEGFGIHNLEGYVAARLTAFKQGGQYYALLAIAAAEAFPDNKLQDLTLHWGIASRDSADWQNPPPGWKGDPDRSTQVYGAWQTPFERLVPPGYEGRPDITAYSVTLQLPFVGPVYTGGLCFMLKAGDTWLGCSKGGPVGSDFHVSFRDLGERVRKLERTQKPTKDPFASIPGAEPMALAEMIQAEAVKRKERGDDDMVAYVGGLGTTGWHGQVADWMVYDIAQREPDAERSLMHRFNTGLGLLETALGQGEYEAPLVAIAVWLRYSAARHLVWNKNYNVKPREISSAQDRLTVKLGQLYEEAEDLRDVVKLTMAAVGRGGQGDAGQRIRDEILDVQQKNQAKGGMMEEWHQKLHNNTSPDDVVICEALIAYLESGLKMEVYWDTLNKANVTKERLASYDRPVVSEPSFRSEQVEGLTRDLKEYLVTLKAVHSGADLSSAAGAVMGYIASAVKGKEVRVDPVPEVATPRLKELLQATLAYQQLMASGKGGMKDLQTGLEAILETRRELLPTLRAGNQACGGRLRDVIYLDLALESAARSALEASLGDVKAAAGGSDAERVPSLIRLVALALEGVCLSLGSNKELVLCLKDFQAALRADPSELLLRAQAASQRTSRELGALVQRYTRVLQPTAMALGQALSIPDHAQAIFSEEVIRGSPAAPLSQLLNVLDPVLRSAAGQGGWQVIAPVQNGAAGQVVLADSLADVQEETYSTPTVLVVEHIGGEEEVPAGAVAVITPDAPDVLCHSAVRARNSGVLLAACFDADELTALRGLAGKLVKLTPAPLGSEMEVQEVAELGSSGGASEEGELKKAPPIVSKKWCGQYAVAAADFTPDVVGSKSMNTIKLMGKLPGWIKQPASLALPFGTFEQLLELEANTGVKKAVAGLATGAGKRPASKDLAALREAIQALQPTPELVDALKATFGASGIAWPEGSGGWEGCWAAMKEVWASKWNERAVVSLGKAGLEHPQLRMAVLVQQVVPAAYAFVAHTTNPTTGDKGEIYVELVRGFGEALVANYPGAPLTFTAAKGRLPASGDAAPGPGAVPAGDDVIRVLGFPSKSVALVLPEGLQGSALIFRSDSNGEDLEGYAGAGLFDSVQSPAPISIVVDYSSDPVLNDAGRRSTMIGAVAMACRDVENAMGSPQDVEGVVTADGTVYVVQTRPQV